MNLKHISGFLVFGTLLTGCTPANHSERSAGQNEPLPACLIGVPADPTSLIPGQACSVTILLSRSISAKQDVDLTFVTAGQIEVRPASICVKTADSSAVRVRLKAHPDSIPGNYAITVFGSSTSGARTSATFQVRIIPSPLPRNIRRTVPPAAYLAQLGKLNW